MPPQSSARKASLISNAPSAAEAANGPRRTGSGRAIRANAARPANYYARPFAVNAQDEAEESTVPLGFFPAITFFTDAITALPKEVMRQFTLMKEVEAKVHWPTEELGEMCDELMQQPVPRRRDGQTASAAMMSFTAPNSAAGSTSASLVNGVAPYVLRNGHESATESYNGEDANSVEGEESMVRRRKYAELRALVHNLLPNMDEKNVVLTEAIRVMNLQLSRIDSVMPHVEAELPEEARLGSMTHWAYSDNRIKTKTATQSANEKNRRDVVATNNLAAAASAVHESEIAQARRDAGKEATREKHGRGRHREQVDSEFEDKPKKSQGKVGRGKVGGASGVVTGLGITTNGEPVKKRKVDKGAHVVPSMERQGSSLGRGGGKGARESAKGTPTDEVVKKTKANKGAPAPLKRRGLNSAQASPAIASSPLQMQISSNSTMEPPGGGPRVQSGRMRQNSLATNLRHEHIAEGGNSRPVSAAGGKMNGSGGNGEKGNGRKRAREEKEVDEGEKAGLTEQRGGVVGDSEANALKREDGESRPTASRSNSSNKAASGGQSKTGTPRSENFPPGEVQMSRTRSTRSMRGNETPGAEPTATATATTTTTTTATATATPAPPSVPIGPPTMQQAMKAAHRRNGGGSVSGLMKQIAPFNKSPDLDRHRSRDDMDDDMDSGEEESRREIFASGEINPRRSRPLSRPGSRPSSSMKRGGDTPGFNGSGVQYDDAQEEREQNAEIQETMDDVGDEDNPPALVPDVEGEDVEEDEADDRQDGIREEVPAASPSLTPEVSATEDVFMEELEEDELDEEMGEEAVDDAGAAGEIEEEEEEEEEEDDGEEPDPDDPNEPKYCYCERGSYGDMVGCDNPKCPREWFHLGCTDLTEMPGEEESWYCTICRPRGSGSGRRGGGRGRGRGV